MGIRYTNDMTPFDMTEKPSKQYPFLMPLIWLAAFIDTRRFGLKIRKEGMEGIKPPYLVIATHMGPADYSAAPLAMFPRRAMYVSDMEGFEYYGKWLYRGLGCIGKRRYVSDISVVKNIKYALDKKQAVFIYPEARHSNVGTTAYIPKNLGKLCKFLKVPVVIFRLDGCYLANPFWDELHSRKVPMEGRFYKLFDTKEVREKSAEEIQEAIEKALEYNEYRYQNDKKIKITEPKRAEGLHKALYVCKKCGAKYKMKSHGDTLRCGSCGREYLLREDGFLEDTKTGENFVIPDWYEWERGLEIDSARLLISMGKFNRSYPVTIEALPNHKGFVKLGDGVLSLDENEFKLMYGSEILHFPHRIRESVQTEYDYRGKKGPGIVLSTKDCCYYLYSKADDFNPTELQFVGEWLFQNGGKHESK
jgi:1-acyl-sn-glycerol-3-phosphate acyltransferase/DNA-directed RNA polymerase subunit RPC12/RpoP